MVLMTKTDKDKDKSKFSKMLHDDVEALIANIEAAVKLLEGMMGKANKDRDAKKLAGDLKHWIMRSRRLCNMPKTLITKWQEANPRDRKKLNSLH